MAERALIVPRHSSGFPISRSEQEYRRLLDRLPIAAYTCDTEGLITYFNDHALRMWGRAPRLNDPQDRFCGSFKLYKGDGTPVRHDQCWMALALQLKREYNGQEIIIERPDGERLTVLANANPLRNHSGQVIGAVNVLVDITEQKRAEAVLREADRCKDEFLATLAHELRNPLAPVCNAVQILNLEGVVSSNARQAVDVIERQVSQMCRLIDDLLDVSRIARNKMELRKSRVALEDVLQTAVETSRPLIDSGGHEFHLSLPSQPLYLEADAARLAQAISNLLNNAARYMGGRGHIWLAAERQGSDVVISVRDTGVGIPADMLSRVFEMFAQVDRSLERSQGGLGIGLTLVKRLVELHGGTVEAASDGPGKGSVFTVRLPVLLEVCESRPQRGRINWRGLATSSLRILVVDDNIDSASTLAMMLRIAGNDVRTAHDGLEAVGMADEFRPHAAILDIGLPKLNGYDAARKIREQPWGRKIVLIAVTGWAQDEDKQRSREAGFDHHLVKPIAPTDLTVLLASLEEVANGTASCPL